VYLRDDQKLSVATQEALQKRGYDVSALNFGFFGYGPDQSLIRFKEVLKQPIGHPEAAVLHIFADNDYGDLYRNNIVKKSGNGWTLSVPEKDPTFSLLNKALSDAGDRINNFWRHYNLYRLLPEFRNYYEAPGPFMPKVAPSRLTTKEKTDLIESYLSKAQAEKRYYRLGNYTSVWNDSYDVDLALGVDPVIRHETVEMLAYIMTEFKKMAVSHQICPVVLIEPAEVDIQGWAFGFDDLEKYSADHHLNYSRKNLVSIADEAARMAGIRYINLFDIYASSDNNYFSYEEHDYDDHWSPLGVERAAASLAAALDDAGCVR
jgi:hypothetical protein